MAQGRLGGPRIDVSSLDRAGSESRDGCCRCLPQDPQVVGDWDMPQERRLKLGKSMEHHPGEIPLLQGVS